MKAIVDTNILIRVFTADHPSETRQAEALLRSNDIIVSNHTLCEMVWVLRRLYKFDRAEIKQAINSLAQAERVVMDRAAVAHGLQFIDAGGDFADGVIVLEGDRLGGEIFATFDKKAAAIAKSAGQDCILLSSE